MHPRAVGSRASPGPWGEPKSLPSPCSAKHTRCCLQLLGWNWAAATSQGCQESGREQGGATPAKAQAPGGEATIISFPGGKALRSGHVHLQEGLGDRVCPEAEEEERMGDQQALPGNHIYQENDSMG